MDIQGLKKLSVQQQLGIAPEKFPRIISFIDFANVDKWYERDEFDADDRPLPRGERLAINLQKLSDFLRLFSEDVRFYYGTDLTRPGSGKFMGAARYIFGNERVFTKPVQYIRHDLKIDEIPKATRTVQTDVDGSFILIPKSNFDVEITVDAIRLAKDYDTFCLLSADADFAPLLRYLKRIGKKTMLIKGGRIQGSLGRVADLKISAQDIKSQITIQKQKPGSFEPGLAES